jgi:hypothetical protein
VDDPHNPIFAKIHMLDGDEMRDRFNRAHAARKTRRTQDSHWSRCVGIALYSGGERSRQSCRGRRGSQDPPIATIPLKDDAPPAVEEAAGVENNFETLSITEAKRRLATTLGVKPENIKITVDA